MCAQQIQGCVPICDVLLHIKLAIHVESIVATYVKVMRNFVLQALCFAVFFFLYSKIKKCMDS
jgi:hypothetical protein